MPQGMQVTKAASRHRSGDDGGSCLIAKLGTSLTSLFDFRLPMCVIASFAFATKILVARSRLFNQ